MWRDSNFQIEDHPLMMRYIVYYKKLKELKYVNIQAFYTVAMSFITAPFYTIAISRQLSVTPHKEIYGDYQPENKASKELMKLQNEVTLREAKNFELIKQSRVLEGQKPYRAPIYDNYFETIKGLYRQGILGFYKGNFCRLFYTIMSHRMSVSLNWFFVERFPVFNSITILNQWVCLSLCDMVAHLFFVAENRFILQNRMPQFYIYKNVNQLWKRSLVETLRGTSSHIGKNFFYLLGFYLNFYLYAPNYRNSVLLGTFFSYPYLTAFRRVVCESSSKPGMLPQRYLNTFHAIFLIKREEGLFRGLYKGFLSYLLATFIWASTVPVLAQFQYYQSEIDMEKDMLDNDPVFEEIKRRKLAQIKSSTN
jgi:hypothetical protein